MKNKGLIIAMIIALSVIILGLIILLVGCINTNSKYGFINFGRRSGELIFDEKYEINEINNIKVLSDAADITFEESTDENIRIVAYGYSSEDINVILTENDLNIKYKKQKREWFNFGFYSNDNITVYIPQDYSNKIKIENQYGNCEITDLENATIDIDADCGNINLGRIKNATLKCDYGNIEIEAILNRCDIKSDCGNVEIEEIQIKEDSTIRSDLGNIEINKINDIYIEADVDLGNKSIKNNNRNSEITLKIKADCGNITIEE